MTRSAVTGVEGAGSGGNSPLRGGCDIDAAPGAAHPTRRVAAPTVARLAATIRLPSTARVAPAWTECRSAEAGEARLAAQFSIEPEWAGADDFVILNSAILDLASGPASVRDEKYARMVLLERLAALHKSRIQVRRAREVAERIVARRKLVALAGSSPRAERARDQSIVKNRRTL